MQPSRLFVGSELGGARDESVIRLDVERKVAQEPRSHEGRKGFRGRRKKVRVKVVAHGEAGLENRNQGRAVVTESATLQGRADFPVPVRSDQVRQCRFRAWPITGERNGGQDTGSQQTGIEVPLGE